MQTGARTADSAWLDLTTAGQLAGLSPRVILLAVVAEEIQHVDTDAPRPDQWRLWRDEFESWVKKSKGAELTLVG